MLLNPSLNPLPLFKRPWRCLTRALVFPDAEKLPADFDLRECYREEHGDVPATVQDYETGQPSRCALRATASGSDALHSM